jgi:hypothetical protein
MTGQQATPRDEPRFAMDVPDDWMVLALSGERISDQLSRLLDDGAARDAGFAAHRGAMEKQIRQVLKSVRGQNVSFAAMHATVINDLLPVLATLTIAMRPTGNDGVAGLLGELRPRPSYKLDLVTLRDSGDAAWSVALMRLPTPRRAAR